jgi:hypothetical protein
MQCRGPSLSAGAPVLHFEGTWFETPDRRFFVFFSQYRHSNVGKTEPVLNMVMTASFHFSYLHYLLINLSFNAIYNELLKGILNKPQIIAWTNV